VPMEHLDDLEAFTPVLEMLAETAARTDV
jgi:hypothetical protein